MEHKDKEVKRGYRKLTPEEIAAEYDTARIEELLARADKNRGIASKSTVLPGRH